jgi:hypothetical protein
VIVLEVLVKPLPRGTVVLAGGRSLMVLGLVYGSAFNSFLHHLENCPAYDVGAVRTRLVKPTPKKRAKKL